MTAVRFITDDHILLFLKIVKVKKVAAVRVEKSILCGKSQSHGLVKPGGFPALFFLFSGFYQNRRHP